MKNERNAFRQKSNYNIPTAFLGNSIKFSVVSLVDINVIYCVPSRYIYTMRITILIGIWN